MTNSFNSKIKVPPRKFESKLVKRAKCVGIGEHRAAEGLRLSRGAVELLGGKVQPGVTVSKVRSKVQSYV